MSASVALEEGDSELRFINRLSFAKDAMALTYLFVNIIATIMLWDMLTCFIFGFTENAYTYRINRANANCLLWMLCVRVSQCSAWIYQFFFYLHSFLPSMLILIYVYCFCWFLVYLFVNLSSCLKRSHAQYFPTLFCILLTSENDDR